MTATVTEVDNLAPPPERPVERGRGKWGMWLFIGTEAMLFALLFFAYFYLASSKAQWPPGKDPSLFYAIVLLVILLTSSLVAWWGESGIKKGNSSRLNIGIGLTLLLAGAFLWIQVIEYNNHLKELRPTDNAYGSIFYTITSLHMGHVIAGVFMLAFVFARGLAGQFRQHRHQAASNAILYWHFVDAVWVFIVCILYLSPHFYGE